MKENCHNFRTSNYIDMKLGSVTKLDKSNKMMLKKFGDHSTSANCDVIVVFWISGQFGTIRKSDSRRIISKPKFSLKATFYLTKTENSTYPLTSQKTKLLKSPTRLGLKRHIMPLILL